MKRKVLAAQNVSRMCVVCGVDNDAGLHGRFYELDDGELLGVFSPRASIRATRAGSTAASRPRCSTRRSGARSASLDPDAWGVTVELTVRFRKPVPLDGEVRVLGRVTKDSSRLFEGTGEIVLPDGSVAVEASGKYLKMPIDRIVRGRLPTSSGSPTRARSRPRVDV